MTFRTAATWAAGCAAALVFAGAAYAQERFEQGAEGYRGGFPSFGGYYDTFSGYGGTRGYEYRRTPGGYFAAPTLFSFPLTSEPVTSKPAIRDCSGLRRQAQATGSRVWKARYDACRRG